MTEIEEVYREDTIGRRYHTPIKSKKGTAYKEPPPAEVVSVKLNAPMNRDEFKKLNDSLKVTYIQHLRKVFGCTSTQIAEMLGYNPSHFSTLISKLNLKGLFKGRPTKKQVTAWKKFLKSAEPAAENTVKPELKKQEAPMAMFCNCSFTLKGELKVSDIAERIKAMVSDGTPCQISIAINALDNNESNQEVSV